MGFRDWLKEVLKDKNKELLDEFELRMKNLGYTRKIVVYDFLSETAKMMVQGFMHWWSVGIWLDPQKKKVALRLERDNWNEIEIPFDKIQKVEIMEDDTAVAKSGLLGNVRVNAISRGLKVIIIAGDLSSGKKRHHLLLYDPKYGAKMNKSDENYKSIQECALSIADEIDDIIMNNMRNSIGGVTIEGDMINVEGAHNTVVNKSKIKG